MRALLQLLFEALMRDFRAATALVDVMYEAKVAEEEVVEETTEE